MRHWNGARTTSVTAKAMLAKRLLRGSGPGKIALFLDGQQGLEFGLSLRRQPQVQAHPRAPVTVMLDNRRAAEKRLEPAESS